MKKFVKDAALLFLALRAGDLVNLAAGMWFIPKYVSQEMIGAVLPVSSFATFLSLPLFALAMTVMKETAVLSAAAERGKIKALLRGVFLSASAAIALTTVITAVLLPKFMTAMRINDTCAGFLVIAAAFLGCVAPVWTDALQAMKRFRALAAVEIIGALGRFVVMAAVMPFKALAGFFAGQATLPALRIMASSTALLKDLDVEVRPFWNAQTVRRMSGAFIAILAYQGVPMFVSMLELSIIRTALADSDSAGYYMVSRFSDFLHYLTFPLLLVLFPYTAAEASCGKSTGPFVVKCAAVVLAASAVMAAVYRFAGGWLLALMPNGAKYLAYSSHMPILTVATALTSCQIFHTNTEVSAGRFGFLGWFIPLNLGYAAIMYFANTAKVIDSLEDIITCFTAIATARFLFSAIDMCRAEQRHIPT